MNLIKDDVRKLFYRFLIPVVSSAVAVAIYSLVDTIAIGQGIGPEGTAACALLLPVFAIATFIALLCGVGGSVLMSIARGEGNKEKGDAYFTVATVLVSVFIVAVWLFGCFFQTPFYRLCGADDALLPYTAEYGKWIFMFMPSFILNSFLGCFIRTDGSPKFVMAATLIGGVLNIIGDWLFVFPLDMGMDGAAIATVIGSVVQTILLISYLILKKTTLNFAKPFEWFPSIKKILVTGCSSGIGGLALIAVSFIANNQIMKYADGAALAVYGVLGTVSALFTSIFTGVGQAVQPIASENYGAGFLDRCKKAKNLGMKNAIIFGAVFSAVSIAFPVEVTGFFMKMTPEVEAVTPYIVRVFSLSYVPQAICIFCGCYLQSVNHPKKATVISMLRGFVFIGTFLLIFPLVFDGNGIWWAIFFAEFLTALVSLYYMLKIQKEEVKL